MRNTVSVRSNERLKQKFLVVVSDEGWLHIFIRLQRETRQPSRHGFLHNKRTTKRSMTAAIICIIMLLPQLLQKMSNILEIAVVMTVNETIPLGLERFPFAKKNESIPEHREGRGLRSF